MAVLKHIASKNADYSETERYLTFAHDENTGKLIRDEEGYPIPREHYLLEGINCNPETFARECRKVNKQFRKNQTQKEIKTHHFIISFDPKDREMGLTSEMAQELGMEFAKKHFPGHQAMVCTHDDGSNGSGNIHVHIVINSIRMMDVEAPPFDHRPCDTKAGFKHCCTRPFMAYLRRDLMEMCVSHGLNQVDLNRSASRVTNAEYRAAQRGQERLEGTAPTSQPTKFETEKEKIRQAILAVIQDSADTEEFKRKLANIYGIQVRESRGRWSYLPPGRQKPITGRKLGDAFEKEAVENAILGAPNLTFVQNEQKLHPEQDAAIPFVIPSAEGVGRVVDMEHNHKVQESAGYANWAKLHNLQEQSKTFNFLTENGLLDERKLEEVLASVTGEFHQQGDALKATESRLREVNRTLRLLGQYYKTKKVYREYCNGGKKEDFKARHRSELDLYESASQELRERFGDGGLPSITDLKAEKAELTKRKEKQYSSYCDARSQWLEICKISRNRDSFLAQEPEPEKKPVDLG